MILVEVTLIAIAWTPALIFTVTLSLIELVKMILRSLLPMLGPISFNSPCNSRSATGSNTFPESSVVVLKSTTR